MRSCPNCLYVHEAAQDRCPICAADAHGEGAEVAFDGATRSAIQHLGGIYGGILPGPPGLENAQVLWCARGVCLVDAERGLAWRTRTTARVDDVSVRADALVLSVRGFALALDPQTGMETEGEDGVP